MAMSAGSAGGDETPMSDINTTPLVDVMLVLLIIFLIAVPVVVQTIELQLPKVAFEPTTTKPENVSLRKCGFRRGLPGFLEPDAREFVGTAGSCGGEAEG